MGPFQVTSNGAPRPASRPPLAIAAWRPAPLTLTPPAPQPEPVPDRLFCAPGRVLCSLLMLSSTRQADPEAQLGRHTPCTKALLGLAACSVVLVLACLPHLEVAEEAAYGLACRPQPLPALLPSLPDKVPARRGRSSTSCSSRCGSAWSARAPSAPLGPDGQRLLCLLARAAWPPQARRRGRLLVAALRRRRRRRRQQKKPGLARRGRRPAARRRRAQAARPPLPRASSRRPWRWTDGEGVSMCFGVGAVVRGKSKRSRNILRPTARTYTAAMLARSSAEASSSTGGARRTSCFLTHLAAPALRQPSWRSAPGSTSPCAARRSRARGAGPQRKDSRVPWQKTSTFRPIAWPRSSGSPRSTHWPRHGQSDRFTSKATQRPGCSPLRAALCLSESRCARSDMSCLCLWPPTKCCSGLDWSTTFCRTCLALPLATKSTEPERKESSPRLARTVCRASSRLGYRAAWSLRQLTAGPGSAADDTIVREDNYVAAQSALRDDSPVGLGGCTSQRPQSRGRVLSGVALA